MSEIKSIQKKIRNFCDERDWRQFHNPKDMATAISIEAAELQEIFLWKSSAECLKAAELERERLLEEIADIAIYLLGLADNLSIDLIQAVEAKLLKNAKKYPSEQVRGSSKKYIEYSRKTEKPR